MRKEEPFHFLSLLVDVFLFLTLSLEPFLAVKSIKLFLHKIFTQGERVSKNSYYISREMRVKSVFLPLPLHEQKCVFIVDT